MKHLDDLLQRCAVKYTARNLDYLPAILHKMSLKKNILFFLQCIVLQQQCSMLLFEMFITVQFL